MPLTQVDDAAGSMPRQGSAWCRSRPGARGPPVVPGAYGAAGARAILGELEVGTTGVTLRGMRRFAGVGLGLCLGLLALGPGMRRGFLLSYDMVFVPREPFSAALPGGAPARAVPSDLVMAVAERILPGDIVQKLVLLSIFMLACAGMVAVLDLLDETVPLLARLAAGAFYAWNPYVGERLIIGQWALLLGYAGLPWVLRAMLRPDSDSWRGAARQGLLLGLALLPAIVGGFAAMAVSALVIVPAAVLSRTARKAAVALAVLAIGSLPWFVPSLLHPVYADPAGVAAFAARADTPFGSIGSLIMLGGMWNAQTVPKAYGGPWSALWLAVVVLALAGGISRVRSRVRSQNWRALAIAAIGGLLLASVGITAAGRDLLRSVIAAWPGAAVLRDGQQFVAPLALAEAAGFGVAVSWAMNPSTFRKKSGRHEQAVTADLTGAALAVLALLVPVLLLPGLAWGAAGRLRPAWYPASWLAVAARIDASPVRGDVLLLPWETERTPAWNHGEVMLDPWPRLLSRAVIWNDGTEVGGVQLAPDNPQARQLSTAIGGTGPLTTILLAAGVRFVLDDADALGPPAGARLPGAVVLADQPGLIVYQLPG
jgi:hypothetical protein